MYGYPDIGGSNITRTEGKIGGTEGDNYKFDGTIDHGNSGGGAFDKDGKLVGIPYAVRSDNGMIGYIIPTTNVKDFLASKTYNIEKYASGDTKKFNTYIKNVELPFKNQNAIKTKFLEIKNANKVGFFLKSVTQSEDGRVFDYRFIDKNERVAIVVACTKDASSRRTSIDVEQQSYSLKNSSPNYTSTGKFIDGSNTLFLSTATPVKDTNGERIVSSVLYNKSAPGCNINILANDGFKKDKALYEKALEFAKQIKFPQALPLTKSFSSSFFSTSSDLPDWVYIGE